MDQKPIDNFISWLYYSNIEIFVKLSQGIKNKKLSKVLLLLCSPILLTIAVFKHAYATCWASKSIRNDIQADKLKTFPHELALVAIAKNEGMYLKEWIDYYLLMGVTKIYLYDNESSDCTANVVKPYVENGTLDYILWPGEKMQIPCYNDAIKRFKDTARYFIVVDCDEFIQPIISKGILEIVNDCISQDCNAVGLAVNWMMFGSSGKEKAEKGLVIERFLRRAESQEWPNRHIKTICNPRFVLNYISPHYPIYRMGCYSVSSKGLKVPLWFIRPVEDQLIRCNHYFCKSKEEFIKKRNRGMADRNAKYDFSQFEKYDLNAVFDESMLQFANQIKRENGVKNE
ncbi:glycosyltransferase family 92 protein [Holdemanella sp.]|uniref:glycosyltransferase family 92 protein n=1 Tax=Holdemanella sp. TaxID=1971762 RepID=UPI003AF1D5D1